MKFKILLVLGVTLLPFSAHSVEVSKTEWVEAMSTVLPAALCKSNQFFRQCFRVSAHDCEETAASATKACLNKYTNKIPSTLVQPRDGTYWGTIVGQCAGSRYGTLLETKYIKNKKCSNPNNWK